jgi:citrate lyase subunit beta / citryl-CoA lyase
MNPHDTITSRITQARTFLFVPGNRPERFEKALRSGADAVILDLEDGVPASDKLKARATIAAEWLRVKALGVPVVVRINALTSELGAGDLEWLATLDGPAAVMLPKAEAAEPIARARAALKGLPVLPLIESAAGYAGLAAVASAPGVLRLALGHIDFMADTGLLCDENESEVAPLRFEMAMATRLNRLAPAIDGVTVQFADLDFLRRDMRRALRFGFSAKMCIHPAQIAVVHEICAPTEEELAWARKVLAADEAAGGAAVQLEGRLVDLPVVLQARRTVARAAPR